MSEQIYHSVKIDETKCIGCVVCMKACPTKAIRIKQRKAVVIGERCIDCGECLRICPYNAITPLTTKSSDINKFKMKVALPSPVIYSQFGPGYMPDEILYALKDLGFDYVYDEALVCEMASIAIQEYLERNPSPRPIISSTCPVVVRLIQRLFPDLVSLIIKMEPPREIAAKNLRKELSREYKIPESDIGIFHITPCAAKMVSINKPETMEKSYLDGAISIKEIYNQVMARLKNREKNFLLHTQSQVSGIGIGWAISGGEIRGIKSDFLVSVSGVYDTIKILNDVESGKIKNIDYLECLICPDGCIGGPLTVENRFLAKSTVLSLIRRFGGKNRIDTNYVKQLYDENFFSFERDIKPKPFPPLDSNKNEAIKKLKKKEKILKTLPGINCGVCGSPDCETFAEDLVRNEQGLTVGRCVFLGESNL
jgi:iron only hydrogenase large subunit-like protein|uniref:4Fe-4S dicluster domain-containing protein n=1 Tax=candidate division WOR-3 bacterium TaxID=2052148 RepID=A0A7V3RI65_UNCW3